MERREDDQTRQPGGEGEDHREGPPGYDLDEQRAIEDLEAEQESGAGESAPGE